MNRIPTFSFLLCLLTGIPQFGWSDEAITPSEVINLLHDSAPEDFVVHLNEKVSLTQERDEIWDFDNDGNLFVSGKGMGYIRTAKAYEEYHLVMEYMWGERTLAGRADRARDCGLLIHAYGPDGAYGNTWMSCIESQLIEGGSGDVLVLATKNDDGSIDPTSVTATVTRDRDGEPVWDPKGESETFPAEGKTMARINWQHRDPDWADVKGFRGPNEVENQVGEWNRMEVICKGDTMTILLNGIKVNEVTNCKPSSGFIGLQTELAECHIRRLELHPIGSYSEKWAVKEGSTDMGYSITGESILPRTEPLSPEESRKLWELDGDYEIQLVASEPLTCDPVDVVWDAKGRMFVAEMGDYPLPVDEGPHLSRIRLLTDKDGDGVMDGATTWADDLDHVQGLTPMNGGLLATTRTAILFLKDTDNDDVADVREVLFRSNEPRHNQLQVSSPRYGLNNEIFLSNGLDGKEIYPEKDPDKVLNFTKLNLRYNPRTNELRPATGAGQYGGTIDDFNRHFFCSNRNPAMFAVMPLEAVKRNPLAGITTGHEDIQPPGAPVRPVAVSHTTSAAHAGTTTAACGIAVYRGDAVPDLQGDIFVCDPTSQLVTRNKLVKQGASYTAERVGETRDFLASGDEWSRPVQVRNGPDGALYVVDMYRRFIDHARFFPEDFANSHYMRAGLDQGRIWRIVKKGAAPAKTEALPEAAADLVPLLSDANGWQRTEAQRLLVEQQDKSIVPALETLLGSESPTAVAHAMGTLSGLDSLTANHLKAALNSNSPDVRELALTLTHESGLQSGLKPSILDQLSSDSPRVRFLALSLFPEAGWNAAALTPVVAAAPNGDWLRKAIMSSAPDAVPAILANLLNDKSFLALPPAEATPALEEFAKLTAARGKPAEIAAITDQLAGEPVWWHFALTNGIAEGLKRSSLKQKSLAALIKSPPEELVEGSKAMTTILEKATTIALDRKHPIADRLGALTLVSQRPYEEKLEIVDALIVLAEAPAIQSAACQLLSRDNREKVADFFFERWKTLAPTPRREALELITGNTKTGLALMKKMKAGEISPAIMPPMTRWSYGRSSNEEIKTLATELFGSASSDRSALINEYRAEIPNHQGDPENGKLVFQKATCVICHKVGDIGVDVGPPLNDVKIKQAEALMTDILDPNRAVEERWVAQTIETTDGRTLSGLIHAEDAVAITLRVPGGQTLTVPRAEVKSLTTSGFSLMPPGLEAAITKTEMIDLIAFLKMR
ncbi:MAG: DUF1080 domain-containing protein [Verrucomicrobiales bacterium]|nr:DUF1080 domain-containing protein [Verrucomicrobiales bacterium]